MFTFLDGPAAGQSLDLLRAPSFLRVTEVAGEWDGLDQLEDTPAREELIHVYQLTAPPRISNGMLDYTDKRGRRCGRPFRTVDATYRYYSPQPPDATARDTALWRAWCLEQPRGPQGTAISAFEPVNPHRQAELPLGNIVVFVHGVWCSFCEGRGRQPRGCTHCLAARTEWGQGAFAVLTRFRLSTPALIVADALEEAGHTVCAGLLRKNHGDFASA